MDKVSILIVSYNQERYIADCIESCLNQNGVDEIELVICDDGSKDNTPSIISSYSEKYPNHVKSINSLINRGISANINSGLKVCEGKWIKLIAGDDMLSSSCIRKLLNQANVYKADLFFSDMKLINSKNEFIGYTRTRKSFFSLDKKSMLKVILSSNNLLAPSLFIRRDVFMGIGGADERFPMIEDYPMWLKIIKGNYKIHFVDDFLVNYRVSESLSISSNRIGNLSYILSLYDFRRKEIWPILSGANKLQIIDDFIFYNFTIFAIRNLSNDKKSIIYKILKLLVSPFRLYTLIKKLYQPFKTEFIYCSITEIKGNNGEDNENSTRSG